MRMARLRAALLFAGVAAGSVAPVNAQLFWDSPDFRGAPVTGTEAGVVIPLPGATPQELSAEVVWTLRAGLNFAALQCQFAPSLMTVPTYNQMLTHHAKELQGDYKLLQDYFKRTAGRGASAAAINAAFDSFNTRTYSSFSTVNAQLGFCQTASRIGQAALMRPKGQLTIVAHDRLKELRNSLVPTGDRINVVPAAIQTVSPDVPAFPPKCFDHNGELKKKCMSRG